MVAEDLSSVLAVALKEGCSTAVALYGERRLRLKELRLHNLLTNCLSWEGYSCLPRLRNSSDLRGGVQQGILRFRMSRCHWGLGSNTYTSPLSAKERQTRRAL